VTVFISYVIFSITCVIFSITYVDFSIFRAFSGGGGHDTAHEWVFIVH
jgi:hypothetical protein